jgi:hypothetical protein
MPFLLAVATMSGEHPRVIPADGGHARLIAAMPPTPTPTPRPTPPPAPLPTLPWGVRPLTPKRTGSCWGWREFWEQRYDRLDDYLRTLPDDSEDRT